MKDIFEFKIVIHEDMPENLVDRFIAFIEGCSVYWGVVVLIIRSMEDYILMRI